MDEITLGMMPAYTNAIWDPWQPWPRVTHPGDYRLMKPEKVIEDLEEVDFGGGRRMRHPFLGELVYPQPPDITLNVGFDVLGKMVTKSVLTLGSTATVSFLHEAEDIIIQEIWKADDLSIEAEFFAMLHEFWTTVMPPGNFVGWYAPDLMPKPYHVKILSVTLGRPDNTKYDPLKVADEPWMLREQLAIAFKPVRDVKAPSGAMVMEGL